MMKAGFLIFSFATAILLSGCVSKEEQNAASETASYVGASRYQISHGRAASTETGTHKTLDITFSGMNLEHVDASRIASAAAYFYFKRIPPENIYTRLDITLKGGSSEFAKNFSAASLYTVDTALVAIRAFLGPGGMDSLKYLLDKKWQDSSIAQLRVIRHRVDSSCGNMPVVEMRGFEISKTSEVEESIRIQCLASNDKYFALYNFDVFLRTMKIAMIEIVGVKEKNKEGS